MQENNQVVFTFEEFQEEGQIDNDRQQESEINEEHVENTIEQEAEQEDVSSTMKAMKAQFDALSQQVSHLKNQMQSLKEENVALKAKMLPNEKPKTDEDDEKQLNADDDQDDDENTSDGSEQELDLVFLMDCTGSMGEYIQKGKESIMNIVQKVQQSDKVNVRFSYIAYRDHPPQDFTFTTRTHDFTSEPKKMRQYLSQYGAQGGGDGPEAVSQAMHEAVNLKYRPDAIKICLLIADAPPHGLNQGDSSLSNLRVCILSNCIESTQAITTVSQMAILMGMTRSN